MSKDYKTYALVTSDRRLVLGWLNSEDIFIDEISDNVVAAPLYVRYMVHDRPFLRNMIQFARDEGIGTAMCKLENYRDILDDMREASVSEINTAWNSVCEALAVLLKIQGIMDQR